MEIEEDETLSIEGEPKSSKAVLDALERSHKVFRDWQDICNEIDDIYSRRNRDSFRIAPLDRIWEDAELDLFWASYEILKPAVYAHVPKPVVSPQFKDRRAVKNRAAELLERTSISAFDRSHIDEVMCEVRDDLIFTNRGVLWITYEAEKGQKVCFEHLDRMDFRHEPARKWREVGWVARRAWMTRKEMRKRFRKTSGNAYQDAKVTTRREDNENPATGGMADASKKASVWEVWHKADNKVYWVSEGVDVLLDEDDPHLVLDDFFPCPRPAYGTLARRSLIPVPDYERYASHFSKINTLTSRIYLLLEKVKLKGLIPSGGDVSNAIEELIHSDDDEILIPVPSAALSGDMSNFVQWMPLDVIATTIQGLIAARSQLIEDFYQLSGISDIMRGATEAEETLGAQQLKSQYGSVRVREKISEIQRIARDAVKIAAEIIAEHFSKDTLLEMSQLEIPTKRDIDKRVKEIENAAEAEMKALGERAEQAAPQIPEDQRQQAVQEFQQAQQALMQKYAGMLNEVRNQVPIEDVMELLRDNKARGFAFEIEDGSTIYADEQAEKASRNEFMAALSGAIQGVMPLLQSGPEGAELAGDLFKFQIAPYRVGRELESKIDTWADSVANNPMPGAEGAEESQDLIAAQNKLAEAEMAKAQAQMLKVQADSQLKQAELQGKMQEMQLKAQKDAAQFEVETGKLQLQLSKQEQEFAAKMALNEAQINKLQADTAKILAEIGLDVRKQDLEEYREARNAQQQEVDTALKISSEGRAERGENRADRSQEFSERQAINDRDMRDE